MSPPEKLLKDACGVSFVALSLGHFKVGEPLRGALTDFSSKYLSKYQAEMVEELVNCPYCWSPYVALLATKGRPIRALQLAGMASLVTSAVLQATKEPTQ